MNKFDEALKLLETWNGDGNTYFRLSKHHDTIRTALTQAAEIERGDKVVVPKMKPMEMAVKYGDALYEVVAVETGQIIAALVDKAMIAAKEETK